MDMILMRFRACEEDRRDEEGSGKSDSYQGRRDEEDRCDEKGY